MANAEKMVLELRPLDGGSYTQFSLSGPLPSAPQRLSQLFATFAFWNGYPVDVVLFVDAQTAGWCEVWADALARVPARHLEVRFRVVAEPVGGAERR
jgi:hypothetical protein